MQPTHHHSATIRWSNSTADFTSGKYSREHTWSFDGGVTVPASASPSVVPVPYSNPDNVDPEEAFVAAVSSCHMLTFLHLLSKAGFAAASYEDEAKGIMTRNERGALWVSRIDLNPVVVYRGDPIPDPVAVARLHEVAHEECFIANSIKTVIIVNTLPPKATP